jgi:hypothetical protein
MLSFAVLSRYKVSECGFKFEVQHAKGAYIFHFPRAYDLGFMLSPALAGCCHFKLEFGEYQ